MELMKASSMHVPPHAFSPHLSPRSGKEEAEKNKGEERRKIRAGRNGGGGGEEISHSSLAALIAQ